MTDQEQGQVTFPEHPCRTPHADRFAADGIRFRNCYTVAAHCCPSRATFMTGLYPSRHGVYNNVTTHTAIHTGLNEGVVTFSELLRDAGYLMSFTGKWHISRSEGPKDRGWDELTVGSNVDPNGDYGIPTSRWAAARDQMQAGADRKRGEVVRPGWGNIQVYGTADGSYTDSNDYRFVTDAVNALPGLAAGDDPWCLFVGPNGPHDPFIIPEPYASMYDPDEVILPPSYRDTLADKPRIYQRWRKQFWDQLSEAEVRESIAHYWGYCTMMDVMFGEVLDALEASGEAENTLVLRMSDHGEYCGAHGLYAKGVAAFREAYQIPLIARWPKGISARGEVDAIVNLLDFAPTFLDLAGVDDGPEEMGGVSLTPFFRGETPEDWRDAHFTQFNGVELYYTQRMVQTATHKYVYNGFDFDELYDLDADPHEMVNLEADPALEDVKKDLVRRMWETALAEEDISTNPYWTVALAPWGPGIA